MAKKKVQPATRTQAGKRPSKSPVPVKQPPPIKKRKAVAAESAKTLVSNVSKARASFVEAKEPDKKAQGYTQEGSVKGKTILRLTKPSELVKRWFQQWAQDIGPAEEALLQDLLVLETKPKVTLTGTDENVSVLLVLVSEAMYGEGIPEAQVVEFREIANRSRSYREAKDIALRYCDVT